MPTLHIGTVHWRSSKWLPIQLQYIKRYVHLNYYLYGFIYPFDTNCEELYNQFLFIDFNSTINHATKLNNLAKVIIGNAKNDDIMVLIDGDAFPCNDIYEDFFSRLNDNVFISIRQKECFNEPIPHPSFFAAKVNNYRMHGFNWLSGPKWNTPMGEVTDVGASIWEYMTMNDLKWEPLLRSNRRNYHPLFFGIYSNTIYHHGAGFRAPISKLDRYHTSKTLGYIFLLSDWLNHILPIRYVYRIQHIFGIRYLIGIVNKKKSLYLFNIIKNDKTFKVIRELFL